MDLISIVMPVFNAESYLDESITSILSQNYKWFEFIIINDGSTDRSLQIIQKYADCDSRICVISEGKLGLIAALNLGIQRAKGYWIARMDADDISMPNRLERQLEYIKLNDLDVCGTWGKRFGSSTANIKLPCIHDELIIDLLFKSSFIHPSIMFKKEFFDYVQYSDGYKHAEDYHLWVEMASNGKKLGNLPEVMILYREHNHQVSSINSSEQKRVTAVIRSEYLEKFLAMNGLDAKQFELLVCNFDSLHLLPDCGCNLLLKIYSQLKGSQRYYYAERIGMKYAILSAVSNRLLIPYLKFSVLSRSFSYKKFIYIFLSIMIPRKYRIVFRDFCRRLMVEVQQ
jgi:glycosyltransferase involved in cell wall biosynthesis